MGQNFINGMVNVGSDAHRPANSLEVAQGTRFSPDSIVLKKEQGRTLFNATAPSTGASSIIALSLSLVTNQLILQQNLLLWRQDVDEPTALLVELFDQKQFNSDADVQLARLDGGGTLTAVRFINTWIIADGSKRPIQVFTNKRGIELGLETPTTGVSVSTAGTGLGGDGGAEADKPDVEHAFPVSAYCLDERENTDDPAEPFFESVEIITPTQFNVEALDDVIAATGVGNDDTAITLVANVSVNQQGALTTQPRVSGGHNLASFFIRMDPTDVRNVADDGPFHLTFNWIGTGPADTADSDEHSTQRGWNLNIFYTTHAKYFSANDEILADPWLPVEYFPNGTGPLGISTFGGQLTFNTGYWHGTLDIQNIQTQHKYYQATNLGPSDELAYWQYLLDVPLNNPGFFADPPLPLDDAVEVGDLAFLLQIGCAETSGGLGSARISNFELTNGVFSDNGSGGDTPANAGQRFTTTNSGLRYGYTELREFRLIPPGGNEPGLDGISIILESNLSPITPNADQPAFSFASQTGVKVVRPPFTNSTTNKWRGYRSTDAVLNEETKDFTKWALITQDMAESQTSFFDGFDRTGTPMDLITPEFLPPFLSIGGAQIPANTPPPKADVVGNFAGHAIFADSNEEGVWRWSRASNPHAVPKKYQAFVDGTVTAFADLGSLLVFTDEQVVSYPSLAVAADSTFLPGRNARIVSPGRGNLSRRGVVVFSMPGREPMAVFTAVDGLWLTNATQAVPFSRMLDWPKTLDVTQLAETELVHDVGERRLLLSFLKDNARWALSFYYDRPEGVRVLGPTRVPLDGMTHTTSDGESLLFSASNGIVYQEKQGIEDWATLEPGSGGNRRIVTKLKSQRIYPWPRRHHGQIKEFGMYIVTPSLGYKVDVTIVGRRDEQPPVPRIVTIPLDEPGWVWRTVDLALESFVIEFESDVPNLSDLAEWDWVINPSGAPRGEGK